MTVYRAEYNAGKWQVVGTSDGINDRVNCGPRWATPREASDYVSRMETLTPPSPLRDSRSGPNEHTSLGGVVVGSSARSEASDRLTPESGTGHPASGSQPPTQPGASPLVGTVGG